MKTFLDTQILSQCCGCGVCSDVCPKNAITFSEEIDNALYPKVNDEQCISCGRCRSVCPINVQPLNNCFKQRAFVGCLNDNNERLKSASGGAFESIVTAVYQSDNDTVIAGAAWEGIGVQHTIVSYEERDRLKKSKYVQSLCTGVYSSTKDLLQKGKNVVFTGTPCQCAALRNYLLRDYDNLLVMDIVCHGVPGQSIFRKYIDEVERKYGTKVKEVSFREKKQDLYGDVHSDYLRLTLDNGRRILGNKKTDVYLIGFHRGVFYRESCYECPYARKERCSDLTIGDYWHIQELFPDLIDYSGVSCILVNSAKGERILSQCKDMDLRETKVSFLLDHNGQLTAPSKKPRGREKFFSDFRTISFSANVKKNIAKRKVLENAISSLLPRKLKRKLKNN